MIVDRFHIEGMLSDWNKRVEEMEAMPVLKTDGFRFSTGFNDFCNHVG